MSDEVLVVLDGQTAEVTVSHTTADMVLAPGQTAEFVAAGVPAAEFVLEGAVQPEFVLAPAGVAEFSVENVPAVEVMLYNGLPGPRGLPGPQGTAIVVSSYSAGEILSGHRAVRVGADGKAYYASSASPEQAGFVVGVTVGAASMGAPVQVQAFGELTEPSWDWVPGPVWLGADGQLTQTPVLSGLLQRMGTAVSATTLFIDVDEAIVRV
jgi:hypothetical protein